MTDITNRDKIYGKYQKIYSTGLNNEGNLLAPVTEKNIRLSWLLQAWFDPGSGYNFLLLSQFCLPSNISFVHGLAF